MKRDNTGIPHTCPLIDNIIDYIGKNDYKMSKQEVLAICEKIREENSRLRECANNALEERDSLDKHITYLEKILKENNIEA